MKGAGSAWKSGTSNASTYADAPCIELACNSASGASALCISGSVTADSTYHSAAGLSVFLNQDATGTVDNVTIANSITVTTYGGSETGNSYIRLQMTDSAGNDYCVMDGNWASGEKIPIAKFNSACWDNSGTYASSSTLIEELDLIVPSTGSGDRPSHFCLLNITIQ